MWGGVILHPKLQRALQKDSVALYPVSCGWNCVISQVVLHPEPCRALQGLRAVALLLGGVGGSSSSDAAGVIQGTLHISKTLVQQQQSQGGCRVGQWAPISKPTGAVGLLLPLLMWAQQREGKGKDKKGRTEGCHGWQLRVVVAA